jgi:ABC transport system ATP-binding/permease protein
VATPTGSGIAWRSARRRRSLARWPSPAPSHPRRHRRRRRRLPPRPSPRLRLLLRLPRPLLPSAKVKLSFKEQRELAALPGVIEALEAERDALRARTAGPEFYKETVDAIRDALARLEAIDPELAAAYDRWNALEART